MPAQSILGSLSRSQTAYHRLGLVIDPNSPFQPPQCPFGLCWNPGSSQPRPDSTRPEARSRCTGRGRERTGGEHARMVIHTEHRGRVAGQGLARCAGKERRGGAEDRHSTEWGRRDRRLRELEMLERPILAPTFRARLRGLPPTAAGSGALRRRRSGLSLSHAFPALSVLRQI
jgi:hypothetical protein